MDFFGTLTWPARLTVRVVTGGARVLKGLLPGDGERERAATGAETAPAATEPTVEEPPTRPEPEPTEAEPPRRPEPEPSEDVEPGPRHVDEGTTLVGEFAESGAEEGAGPEVELAEPWEGYDRMHADEVRARLAEVSTETLAAVTLYERAGGDRASVVEEAELQLRRRRPAPLNACSP